MPTQPRECAKCGDDFVLMPGKPGLAIHCPRCSVETEELVLAKVSWDGKHTRILEITKDRKAAEEFNKAQQRGGVGPLSTFGNKPSDADRESSKGGSGAERGAMYHSNLREKRHLKR